MAEDFGFVPDPPKKDKEENFGFIPDDPVSQTKREYVENGGKPEDVYSPERLQTLVEKGPAALIAEPPLKRKDGSIAGPTIPTEDALAKGLIEKRAEPAVIKAMDQGVETVSSGFDKEKGVGFAVGRDKQGEAVRVEEKPDDFGFVPDQPKHKGLQPMSEYQRPDQPANPNDPSFLGALGRGATRSAFPTAAGIAGGAATGAIAGAALTGPAAPAGALIGGLIGGIGAAYGAEKLQDFALDKFLAPETKKAIDEQFAKDTEKQPVASFVGQVAPSFALFRPSPSNLAKAGSFAKQVLAGEVTKEALESPAVREQVSNLVNVGFGAGTLAGLEAFGQIQNGNFDPLRLGASVVLGALQTEPTALGRRVITQPMQNLDETIRNRGQAKNVATTEPQAEAIQPEVRQQVKPEQANVQPQEVKETPSLLPPEPEPNPTAIAQKERFGRTLSIKDAEAISTMDGVVDPEQISQIRNNFPRALNEIDPTLPRMSPDIPLSGLFEGETGKTFEAMQNIIKTDKKDGVLTNKGFGQIRESSKQINRLSVASVLEKVNDTAKLISESRRITIQQKRDALSNLKNFVDGVADSNILTKSNPELTAQQERPVKYAPRPIQNQEQVQPKPDNLMQEGGKTATVPQDQAQPVQRGSRLEPLIQLGNKLKAQAGRLLKTGGNLPKEVFSSKESADFGLNETKLKADFAVDDFNRAVESTYGTKLEKLPQSEINKLNDALANESVRSSLPPELGNAVGNMRNMIDEMSSRLMPLVGESMRATIDANRGVYFYRSYEKFINPNYKGGFSNLDPKVQNKLVALVKDRLNNNFAEEYARKQSEARGEPAIRPKSNQYKADYGDGLAKAMNGGVTYQEVKGVIDYLQTPEADSPFAQFGSRMNKDLSILTRRKQIPEEIRLLWGEIKDPRVNFLQSVERIGGFVETHNLLKSIRDAGMNKWLFDRPIEGFSTKLVSDGSKVSSPLNMFVEGQTNDVYTSQEISQALQDTFGGRSRSNEIGAKLVDLYLKVNAASKFTKTVLSPVTQVRNILGNIWFLVREGYVFSPEIVTAFKNIKGAIGASGAKLGVNRNVAAREYASKLTKLGIFGQSVRANELSDYFRDANITNGIDLLDSLPIRAVKKSVNVATKLYELGDAIPKALAFEIELNRAKATYPELSLEAQEKIAASTVLDSLPTYSRIPMAGNVLRKQPFVGAFVSFPLEVIRTNYNFIGRTVSEINSNNPAVRQIGFRRLFGGLAAYIGFTGAAEALRMASGVTDEEDKASRRLDAPWDRYSTKAYLGNDERGNVRFVNLSYLDPSNYLRDPLIAVWKKEGDWREKLLEGMKTFFEPFVGEQILTGKILDVARNKKALTGGAVYNPQDSIQAQAASIVAHVSDAFTAGAITTGLRIYRGATGDVTKTGRAYNAPDEIMAAVLGQRVVTQDTRQSLMFEATKFKRALNESSSIYSQAFYDRSRDGVRKRPEAYQAMLEARREVFSDISSAAKAAMTLGVPRGEVLQILRNQGVSDENSRAIVNGYVPYVSQIKKQNQLGKKL